MMDMIEKVARAIAQDLARQDGVENPVVVFDAGPLVWSYVDQNYVDFGSIARAAIEAMRDIPPEMIDSAWGFGVADWNMAIDAALAPSPPLGED